MTGKKCGSALPSNAGWYGRFFRRVGDEANVVVVIVVVLVVVMRGGSPDHVTATITH